MTKSPHLLHCSFCSKDQNSTITTVFSKKASETVVAICNECFILALVAFSMHPKVKAAILEEMAEIELQLGTATPT